MKTCEEMVNSLFERREQYRIEQKKRRKQIAKITTSVCCVAIVAFMSIWYGNRFGTNATSENSFRGSQPIETPTEDHFHWNTVLKEAHTRLAVAFEETTCEEWLKKFPMKLPEDMSCQFALGYEIDKETAQPTDEVVSGYISGTDTDGNTILLHASFYKEAFKLNRDLLYLYFSAVPENIELSKIANHDVFLGTGQGSNEILYAIYNQDGITVMMEFRGKEQDKFPAILRTVLTD